MEITGYRYLAISNKFPTLFLKNFNIKIKNFWESCIVFEVEEMHEFENNSFFYTYVKDREMDEFFEENAYRIDSNSEGPFSIYASMYKNISISSNSDCINFYDGFDPEKNFPYGIFLSNAFLYSLTLPENKNHEFCKKVIEIFNSSL